MLHPFSVSFAILLISISLIIANDVRHMRFIYCQNTDKIENDLSSPGSFSCLHFLLQLLSVL